MEKEVAFSLKLNKEFSLEMKALRCILFNLI